MKLVYEQITKKLNSSKNAQNICLNIEKQSVKSWISKFRDNVEMYGTQNGPYPPPMDAIYRHSHMGT